MKKFGATRLFGIFIIVLAIAIAVLPQFTDCQSQGKAITLANGSTIPMKCHWTAQAELATAVPLLAVGSMMVASRRKETIRNVSIMGVILGVIVMLLPTSLIGTCSSMMVCNTLMKPALLSFGGLVTAFSLVGAIISFRSKEIDL